MDEKLTKLWTRGRMNYETREKKYFASTSLLSFILHFFKVFFSSKKILCKNGE